MSKELILLCHKFVKDHPMDNLEEFDTQEFFEGCPEENLIEFFRDLYQIIEDL